MMKKSGFWSMLLLSQLLGIYALALLAFPQLGVPELIEKLSTAPVSMTSHFAGSGIALMIGPWLFLAGSRRRAWVHRYLGRLYMLGVLVGGAASIYMSPFADGGVVAQTGFLMLAIFWIGSGYAAYRYARLRLIREHQRMMTINFALTFAAVTLRLYLPVGALSGMAFETYYAAIAWLCWVPNILVAMWIIPATASREARRTTPSQSKNPLVVTSYGQH